eukprot:4137162-Prymnesium_polylepis.1
MSGSTARLYGITVHHTTTRHTSATCRPCALDWETQVNQSRTGGLPWYGLWCAVRRYRALRALCLRCRRSASTR